MGFIRTLIRDHRALAMLVLALALCVKLVLPQGYMLGETAGVKTLTVQLCFDGSQHKTIEIAIPTTSDRGGGKASHDSKPDEHCPFTSLAMATDSGADAPLLAIALAFILALGFAPVTPVLRQRAFHLRPPLRGPPALA